MTLKVSPALAQSVSNSPCKKGSDEEGRFNIISLHNSGKSKLSLKERRSKMFSTSLSISTQSERNNQNLAQEGEKSKGSINKQFFRALNKGQYDIIDDLHTSN